MYKYLHTYKEFIHLQQSNQIGQNVTAMVSSMSNPSLRGYAHELMMCTQAEMTYQLIRDELYNYIL